MGWKMSLRKVSWTKEKSFAINIHLLVFFYLFSILKIAEFFDNLTSTSEKRQLFLKNLEFLMMWVIIGSAENLIQGFSWQNASKPCIDAAIAISQRNRKKQSSQSCSETRITVDPKNFYSTCSNHQLMLLKSLW